MALLLVHVVSHAGILSAALLAVDGVALLAGHALALLVLYLLELLPGDLIADLVARPIRLCNYLHVLLINYNCIVMKLVFCWLLEYDDQCIIN